MKKEVIFYGGYIPRSHKKVREGIRSKNLWRLPSSLKSDVCDLWTHIKNPDSFKSVLRGLEELEEPAQIRGWSEDGLFEVLNLTSGTKTEKVLPFGLEPIAILEDTETSEESLHIRMKVGKTQKEIFIPSSFVGEKNLAKELSQRGAPITPEQASPVRRFFQACFLAQNEFPRKKVSSHLGWISLNPPMFLPSQDAIFLPKGEGEARIYSAFRKDGSPDRWLDFVKEIGKISPHARFTISASLSAPLLTIPSYG